MNLKEAVYEKIKELILYDDIPGGTKLLEKQLCEQLGVSRTPIKDALSRLEQEGLVEIIPRHGAFIDRKSFDEFTELVVVRESLEGTAAKLATSIFKAKDIAYMRSLHEGLNLDEMEQNAPAIASAYIEFHRYIIQNCGNKTLIRFIDNIYNQLRITRIRKLDFTRRWKELLIEHQGIIDAFEKRDSKLTEKLMREHIKNTRYNIWEYADVLKPLTA